MAYDVFETYEKQMSESVPQETVINPNTNNDYISLLEKRLETLEKIIAEQSEKESAQPSATEEPKEELTEEPKESEGVGDGV